MQMTRMHVSVTPRLQQVAARLLAQLVVRQSEYAQRPVAMRREVTAEHSSAPGTDGVRGEAQGRERVAAGSEYGLHRLVADLRAQGRYMAVT